MLIVLKINLWICDKDSRHSNLNIPYNYKYFVILHLIRILNSEYLKIDVDIYFEFLIRSSWTKIDTGRMPRTNSLFSTLPPRYCFRVKASLFHLQICVCFISCSTGYPVCLNIFFVRKEYHFSINLVPLWKKKNQWLRNLRRVFHWQSSYLKKLLAFCNFC